LIVYLSQWLTNLERAWPLILVLLILIINTLLSTATTEKKKIKEKNKLYSACLPNINQHEMRKKQRGLLDCANTEKVGVCRQAKETSGKINMRSVPSPDLFVRPRVCVLSGFMHHGN
jgi:hypothetical protein